MWGGKDGVQAEIRSFVKHLGWNIIGFFGGWGGMMMWLISQRAHCLQMPFLGRISLLSIPFSYFEE